MQHDGKFVEAIAIGVADHAIPADIAEQRQLFLNCCTEGFRASADQNIRLNAKGTQLLYAVLGGLCLNLPYLIQIRDQRDMDKQAVSLPQIPFHLADGL